MNATNASQLLPGAKINYTITDSDIVRTVRVKEVMKNYCGDGVTYLRMDDDSVLHMPNGHGYLDVRYYGESLKRVYFLRKDPMYTPEVRKQMQEELWNALPTSYRGFMPENSQPAALYYKQGVGTNMIAIRDLDNFELYDLLNIYTKFGRPSYQRP